MSHEMRKTVECDMDKFGSPGGSERMIALLGDRWQPQRAEQEGEKMSTTVRKNEGTTRHCTWKNENERPNVGGLC